MKSTQILIFFIYWCRSYAIENPSACMKRDYEKQGEDYLNFSFKQEYSKFLGAWKKLSSMWSKEEPYYSDNEVKNINELCACAFTKIKNFPAVQQRTNFDGILREIKSEKSEINVKIDYFFWVPYPHSFPVYLCQFRQEKYVMAKGYKRQSQENPVHNIYVASIIKMDRNGKIESHKFEGIIRNVNVEMLAYGPSSEN